MGSMKKQLTFISILMVIIIAALTLGGLQLFGKGKVKPSEWFKKADTPQAEQTAPETASYLSSALSATKDNEIMPLADNAQITIVLRHAGNMLGLLVFSGEFTEASPFYTFDLTCDVSSFISQNYSNFRITPDTINTGTPDDPGYPWGFYVNGNIIGVKSGLSCIYNLKSLQEELRSKNAVIECDLIRAEIPLPADPTKEGYTFAGWYYGTQADHGENCRAYDGAPIYEDTALHAHFNINRYTVTYNAAGGTPVANEVVDWNTVASAPEPSRIGYNFVGWVLADGSIYNNAPIKQDTSLTARWEIKTFTVTFYVGEEKHAELTVEYGSTLAEAMEEAEIISYKAMDISGLRVSKQSVITENTDVLVEELTGWEKYGDFVGQNQWYTWLTVGIVGALALTAAISITIAVKRK